MAFTTIIYDEGNELDLGYQAVEVWYGHDIKSKKVFNSKNFVKDWYFSQKFKITELYDTEHNFSCSSSVNHFIMDGAKFDSKYLKIIDNKPILVNEYDGKGTEFFVEQGTNPTWEELVALCDDKK